MGFDTRGSMPVTCPFTCSKNTGVPKRYARIFGIDNVGESNSV